MSVHMSEARHLPPSLSVVVVSDYEERAEKTWNTERQILKALADQEIAEPFAVVLVENSRASDSFPDDLYQIFPRLSIVFGDESQSAKLKDRGVMHCQGEWVAVFEADCLPNRQWLRVLSDVLRQRPEISIAGGRTTYGNESMYRRCLGILDRSFDDLGHAGETIHVSNNGALYRRSVLQKFPYQEAVTPFQSTRIRMVQMRNAGIKFWFDPQAVMRHEIGGWDFVRDFRRNTGYVALASHSKQKSSEIPRLIWRSLAKACADCLRLGPQYLKWYDWPLLLLLLFLTRFPEIRGMQDALQGRDKIPNSAYR